MLIGITGAPSKGKSSFFSAATMIDVPISPRPFTTIEPNKGMTSVSVQCAEVSLGVKCNPQNSKCENGRRTIPIGLLDLAGLVPGAHEGRGLGNKFLDSIRNADVLIQIVDVSGTTDLEGNPTDSENPEDEVLFLENEIDLWLSGIIKRSWSRIQGKNLDALYSVLTGLNMSRADIEFITNRLGLSSERIAWKDSDIDNFAREVRKITMPIVIAANKVDLSNGVSNYTKLVERFPDKVIIPTYADGELALRKAAKAGLIKYVPGSSDFEIIKANDVQQKALEKIRSVMKKNGNTGVQQVIDAAVFKQLGLIVVYPVSDENKYMDNFGNVLPDAIFVRKGTTALQLAERIHTDLAKTFIYAVDAKKKIRISKDHALNDGDVIRIVSGAR